MRGEVLHYDDRLGHGQISGDDGQRYTFYHTDVLRDAGMSEGSLVDFEPDGRFAREIYTLGVPVATAGFEAISAPEQEKGLFGYFVQSYTVDYANFYGRSRRKAYWGFYLFNIVVLAAIWFVTLALFSERMVWVAFGVPLLCLLPSLANIVRRLHDIGRSGWWVLLLLLVSVIPGLGPPLGTIGWIVLGCIDSQPHPNKYGPPPKRVVFMPRAAGRA